MSEAGMAIGTPYYISPEQVRGQVDIDIRADIYSLGATLYHMVTGRVPYGGETPTEVMRKHVDKNVDLVPPDHLNTRLSGGLGMVVETMMAKNRENRYRNPDDLILDLKCLLQGESPMIAGQKPDTLLALAEGEIDEVVRRRPARSRWSRLASYVNNRNKIIAAIGMLLASRSSPTSSCSSYANRYPATDSPAPSRRSGELRAAGVPGRRAFRRAAA